MFTAKPIPKTMKPSKSWSGSSFGPVSTRKYQLMWLNWVKVYGGASPNGFTEVYEGTVAQKYSQSQYRNSSTSTTVAWTDFYTGTGTFTKGGAAAIEVKAAATTRRAIPPIIY